MSSHEVSPTDLLSVGAKVCCLRRLQNHGFPVPELDVLAPNVLRVLSQLGGSST